MNTLKFCLHKTDGSFNAIVPVFCTAKQELQSYLLQGSIDNVFRFVCQVFMSCSITRLDYRLKRLASPTIPVVSICAATAASHTLESSRTKGGRGLETPSELGLHCEPCN